MSIISAIKERVFAQKKKENCWDAAMRGVLIVTVFLSPIFFLPFNTHPIEFNKVILFNVLVLITTIVYLLKVLIQREIKMTMSYLHWAILAFVIFQLVSFVFSQQPYVSAVGVSGYYSGSVLSVICFVLFSFLLLQAIRDKKDAIGFLIVLLLSAAIVIIYNLFQVFGVHLLPWQVTKDTSFNAVSASAEGLAVFIGICLLISFGFLLLAQRKWQRIRLGVFVVLALGLLFLLDQKIIFYVLALSFFVFLLFITFRAKFFSNVWVVLPTIALTLVVLFVFFNSSSLTKIDVKESASLDSGTSAVIAWQSFVQAPWWGSGQQTFTFDFEKYRTLKFNDSKVWNLHFIKGSNEWFTLWATVGLAGVGLFFVIGLWFLLRTLLVIVKNRKPDQDWILGMIIFVLWVALLITSLVMPFNFILTFLWWFILAIGLAMVPGSLRVTKTFSLAEPPGRSVLAVVVFVVVTVGIILIIFFSGKVWLADYYYNKAQAGIAAKVEIVRVQSYLEKAIKLNCREGNYYLSLAQSYATQAQLEALNANADMTKIQQFTQKVIDTLKKVKEKDARNPFVYEQEAAIYAGLRNFISNADELSVKAYARAVEFEPNYPLAYLSLGRAKLLSASVQLSALPKDSDRTAINQLIDQAINDLEKAKSLKRDFVLADYTIAIALELRGEIDKAIAQLEPLAAKYSHDTEILSGLASLYQKKEQYDKAVEAYQNILKLTPDDSTIHWQLALVYEKQGKIDLAITELEIVQKANPDNITVKEKLDALKNPSKTESEKKQ